MKKIVIGILAHVDAGKTTLSEALLYRSGRIAKLGRVDHRDSFLDNDAQERSRGITIFSKQAVFDFGQTAFTLLDTPGHVDFSAEMERTLRVLDYAVLVVSAVDGVQSHTQTLWKLLEIYNIPCFVFINKTDLDGLPTEQMLSELQRKLHSGFVNFDAQDTADFFENIALCDEPLFEKYTLDGMIDRGDIACAIRERKIFPCIFGSALKLHGVDTLLHSLDEYTRMPVYGEAFGARVFKVSEHKGQRLTFLKVTGGCLHVREALASPENLNAEKADQIRIYSGEKFTTINEAQAGTVCAVTGITFASPGDGLGAEPRGESPILTPVLTYRMNLPKGCDAHTALAKMKILQAEDPLLQVDWNAQHAEIRVRLMGEIQLEILSRIIEDRFAMSVTFSEGSIVYRETIADAVEGVGHFEPLRHYAEVHLLLKPGKRGSGIHVYSECKEDVLDKNWQRLILTHLQEKAHRGVLTGSPITDMEISLLGGKAHAKHTEGGDFRQATYRAIRQGLRRARSVLLEPVYAFTLELPNENTGRAMADIQRMFGSFSAPETNGETTLLCGSAPVSEMRGYAAEIARYTHGKGKLSCRLKGYEPCHNEEEVIAQINYDCDGDTENPCDSVFCAHGAGFTVKCDDVENHMHLPFYFQNPKNSVDAAEKIFTRVRNTDAADLFALDRELMQIFERSYGPIKPRTAGSDARFAFTEKSQIKKYKTGNQKKYLPPEYVLVDGYNVIFAWEHLRKLAKDNIDAARSALQNTLCNYQGYKKCEVILVFDAYKVKGERREVEMLHNIHIVYTKEAETADTYIEKVSHELAADHKVRVVTSDGLEQLIIFGNGALRVTAEDFLKEIRTVENEIRQIISGGKLGKA